MKQPASASSNLTDAATPGAGRTNPVAPVYDSRQPPAVPAAGLPPRGTPIPRDTRKNSGGN